MESDNIVADFICAFAATASSGDNTRSSDCSANRWAAAAVRIKPAPYTATTAADPNATRLPVFLGLLLTLVFLLAKVGMFDVQFDTQTPPASLRTV